MNTNMESVLEIIPSVVLLHSQTRSDTQSGKDKLYIVHALPSNKRCSQHRQINAPATQSGDGIPIKETDSPAAWLLLRSLSDCGASAQSCRGRFYSQGRESQICL